MSRKKNAPAVALVRAGRAAPPAPATSPPSIDSPEAVALAARFHEVRRQGMRGLVELAVELGQILIEAHRRLGRAYRPWLREQLGLEPSTAQNYVAMGRMALDAPALVERHKDLGASKLYQVARLEPPARQAILATPGIAALNDREFKKVVDPHRTRRRKVTPAMRAYGMREKLRSYAKAIGAFKPGRLASAAEARDSLRADAEALRAAVDALLERIG